MWVLFVPDASRASHTTSLYLKENAMKCADKKPTYCQNPPLQERHSHSLFLITILPLNMEPWSFIIGVNKMFSPSSDIFMF